MQLNSPAVNDWKQHGKLSLWRYKNISKGLSGIHLHGDTASILSLLELFEAFKQSDNGYRTINLVSTSSAVASMPRPTKPYDSYSKVKLNYSDGCIGILITINGDVLEIELGNSGINKLTHAFQKYNNGEDDFCIHADIHGGGKNDIYIWFW